MAGGKRVREKPKDFSIKAKVRLSLDAVAGAQALTTRQIAELTPGVDSRQTSSALSRLKAEGRVSSRKVRGPRRRFTFALTGELVTRDSYSRLTTIDRELRDIVKSHAAGAPELVKELKSYLDTMLDELDPKADRERAEANCKALLESAAAAKLKKEIYAHLGLRPFYQKINVWSIAH